MKLKICGIRREEDIEIVNTFPPDYVGFVFAKSRRQVTPVAAAALAARLSGRITTVGVFVNEEVEAVVRTARLVGLSAIQLHGDENAAYAHELKNRLPGVELWRAVRVRELPEIFAADQYPADKLLLDAFSSAAYGGTGKTADWELIASAARQLTKPFFLAGGLCEENIIDAIHRTKPFGVDISGGIETDGAKDISKIKKLFQLLGR